MGQVAKLQPATDGMGSEFDSCRRQPRDVEVDLAPRQSGWLIRQFGATPFFPNIKKIKYDSVCHDEGFFHILCRVRYSTLTYDCMLHTTSLYYVGHSIVWVNISFEFQIIYFVLVCGIAILCCDLSSRRKRACTLRADPPGFHHHIRLHNAAAAIRFSCPHPNPTPG